jgi:hypothetical protein
MIAIIVTLCIFVPLVSMVVDMLHAEFFSGDRKA